MKNTLRLSVFHRLHRLKVLFIRLDRLKVLFIRLVTLLSRKTFSSQRHSLSLTHIHALSLVLSLKHSLSFALVCSQTNPYVMRAQMLCNTLQQTLQHTPAHCNTLHHTASHCITLQHTATHCSTLQHTATLPGRKHESKNTQPTKSQTCDIFTQLLRNMLHI